MTHGITVKPGNEGSRLEIECAHQKARMYIVPSESSWVCVDDERHAHAIAGFFRDLSSIQDPSVVQLMKKWGIFFRDLSTDNTN